MTIHFVHKDRIPEWISAGIMVLIPMQLLVVSTGYASQDIMWGMSLLHLLAMFAGLGILRLVVLWINGRWKRTPVIRGISAAICAGIYIVFVLGGYISILPLVISDIYAAYKAGTDDNTRACKSNIRS